MYSLQSADKTVVSSVGDTALSLAREQENMDIVKLLEGGEEELSELGSYVLCVFMYVKTCVSARARAHGVDCSYFHVCAGPIHCYSR